jgi:A/G-specific adenine glycosylase
MTGPDLPVLRRRLAGWFRRHARKLPWRTDRDPYRIWISEVMLQQTQVAAVIPYFERFLVRFPDIASLADAPLHDVLHHWQGLGYYRRARDLHRSAQLLVERHGGAVPSDSDAVRGLPGFGRYTAGALLSQAFEMRLPILEANSARLLCRLFAIDDDPKSSAAQKRLWRIAEDLLPAKGIGDFNQALMELGALVCTPAEPKCGACPLVGECLARRDGLVDVLPRKSAKPRIEQVREVAVVIRKKGDVLLVQRPAQGRWAEMWEFPRVEVPEGDTTESAAAALVGELGIVAALGEPICTIRHGVTRFRITLMCQAAEFRSGRFRPGLYPRGIWLAPARLAEYPVSTPQRKLANALTEVVSPTRKRGSGGV